MVIAIDLLVNDPEAKITDVAEKAGVTRATVHNWLKDPEFVEVFYQKYMVVFGSRLPTVLNSMVMYRLEDWYWNTQVNLLNELR